MCTGIWKFIRLDIKLCGICFALNSRVFSNMGMGKTRKICAEFPHVNRTGSRGVWGAIGPPPIASSKHHGPAALGRRGMPSSWALRSGLAREQLLTLAKPLIASPVSVRVTSSGNLAVLPSPPQKISQDLFGTEVPVHLYPGAEVRALHAAWRGGGTAESAPPCSATAFWFRSWQIHWRKDTTQRCLPAPPPQYSQRRDQDACCADSSCSGTLTGFLANRSCSSASVEGSIWMKAALPLNALFGNPLTIPLGSDCKAVRKARGA